MICIKKRDMKTQLTARERFRAVFEHDTAKLDRLPMLSLGTPSQGLFHQEWVKTIGKEGKNIREKAKNLFGRIHPFGDLTMKRWISSEWHNIGLGYPSGYPGVPLPKDHPEWQNLPSRDYKNLKMNVGWTGGISVNGTSMHGKKYGWYQNGYFTRQKTDDGRTIAPWEVRDAFYAEYGSPLDDKFSPSKAAMKVFQKKLKWYEKNYNTTKCSDFALMTSAGGLFEATWEGMGSGTPGMAIMCKKYPGKLQAWLHQVKELVLKSLKLQFELAEEVDAQIDFVWLWDDSGQKGRSIIDPKYHREFWVPLYKEVTDYIHAHNAFLIIHSCGYGENLIPNWVEGGIDAWQTIERAALNEPARIREKYGNDIILIGAIDASNTVSFAETQGEIIDHVKQTINDAVYSVEDACYIPGFTHDLLDCPVQNVRTAVDAMLKYGQIDEIRRMK
jgi:uroporphyrinogen-III decarboxylase